MWKSEFWSHESKMIRFDVHVKQQQKTNTAHHAERTSTLVKHCRGNIMLQKLFYSRDWEAGGEMGELKPCTKAVRDCNRFELEVEQS